MRVCLERFSFTVTPPLQMDLTWTETLEVKDHYDSRFHWPNAALQHSCVAVATQLRTAAVTVLQRLVTHAHMRWAAVAALLDGTAQPLETASNSVSFCVFFCKLLW